MKKQLLLSSFVLVALFFSLALQVRAVVPIKVLHFTKTSGWDHQTRDNSLQMFRTLGEANGFTVDNDPDGSAFNSLANLQQYAVVVFSNTSGNNILNATQRANFEQYINGGGSIVGIHAASDTYRHSTANGNNRGTWDWYPELIGASVRENPNHVDGTPSFSMTKKNSHPSTANLPNPWVKAEEYYYWIGGYYNQANVPVLEVEQTRRNNTTSPADYDQARPMSWYRQLSSGGRVFYTALGHRPSDFLNDQNFINHIRDAVLWAAVNTLTATSDKGIDDGLRVQNPVRASLRLSYAGSGTGPVRVALYSSSGQQVYGRTRQYPNPTFSDQMDLSGVSPGLYLLYLTASDRTLVRKVVVTR